MPGDAITPFEIAATEAQLDDLRRRLRATRWPDAETVDDWSQGIPIAYVREVCAYWAEKYDWRERETRLNSFPQFRSEIDGCGIHFIHARSPHDDALPIVITHGWPGSVVEFQKVIGPLSDPVAHGGDAADAFHVVCPTLPGYGFSDKPESSGWGVERIADAWAVLMDRLGYARYGAQGGDWGAFVTTWLGILDADHCSGIHLNLVFALPPSGEDATKDLTPEELQGIADGQRFQNEETGYQQIQGTKPQTLGYGLNDSPAGLAAWIVEKFRTWSDCDGDVERSFSKDELLTNIMIYWVTQSITSSVRLYCENRRAGRFGFDQRIEVPTGCAIFPKELYRAPRRWAERRYNVQHWTNMPRGGHFAALEEPELLVEDLRAFFRPLR